MTFAGPECRGGGEDEVTYDQKSLVAIIERFCSKKLVQCQVLGWMLMTLVPHLACLGIPCPKEQTDYIMEPSDLQSKTSCLNRTWIGTWDHFPVVVKIDGKELRVQKGGKRGLDSQI